MILNDKKKKRTCYNCDEDSHFANECPYEKRVDKPKFIKGVKPRLKPNPINDRYKKNKGRAFVGAEYLSDEEEEDEEKEAGVAGLAFSKPGSLFTYDYSKDYSTENDVGSSFMARITQDDDSDDSPSSTIVGSCLMARETKVMESPPSLSSVLDDETENQEELIVLKELYNVRCTLRGEALVKFDFLMDSLKEKDEFIEELEYHLNEKERRFNLLRQELKTERCISQGLKQQIETYELDKVKDLETIDRAQSLTQELNASKEELEVAHASLTRDLDHLERANKFVKDELKKLGENHDLLQETYKKALGSMKDPIVVEKVACSSTSFTSEHAKLVEEHVRLQEELSLHVETNAYLESLVTKYGLDYHPNESSCEQASNLEENVRLTKELAKFTTAKNKMGLDDLLSKQRSNNQKFGLGYAPKYYKKNNYKKEKPAQDKNKKVTNDGKASKGKATSGDRTGPNNHYALFVDYYGDVYANYVGPPGKQLKKSHLIKSIGTTSRPLALLHLDLFGPSHYDTLGGSKYGLVIVDDYSRYSWVFLLNSKDETHREFIIFAKKAQRMYESEIKAIRTNNGTELKNYTMQEFVDDEGIKHEFSVPYTPQQNGVVERKNRTIIDMARTMLGEFNSPHNFWGEAISTAVHYSKRLFLRPSTTKLHTSFSQNNKGKLGKFETRTIEGTFVGYAENSHAYRYYNKSTGAIEVSCDVVFLEDNGSQVEKVIPCVAGNDDDPSNAIKLMGIGHIRPTEVHTDDRSDGVEVSSTAQVEPSSTQAEPSSATQEPSSTQDESHSEEQEESPHSTEQDHDDDQETSSTHDQAQVVPHDQVLARDEFIDHEGTIWKIKAATRESDMKVDQVLGSISKGMMFRESLISKSGDSSEVRNYHLNLMYYCHPDNIRKIDGCDLIHCELKRSVLGRMTPNYAQYVQRLINKMVPPPNNMLDQRIIMEPFKFPAQDTRPEVPAMMPSERRSKERHDHAASSSYSRRPKHGASRFFSSLWQMCKNTNDVAHQSLSLNQETRRRQNEFMAARNHLVPPSGPDMEPVVAPAWEMPPITDEMLKNFDLSMYAHGGLPLGLLVPLLMLMMMMKRLKVVRMRMLMARAQIPLGMSISQRGINGDQRNKKAKGDPPLRQQSKRGLQQASGQRPGWTGLAPADSVAPVDRHTAGRSGANRPCADAFRATYWETWSCPRSGSGLPPGLDRRVRSLARSDRVHDRALRRRPSSLTAIGGSTA
ncbi:hypothetical protein QYE76_022623 [Lolium multiflorum]|uniref:Uncharacterized protein n=1 Tax=Lolium multiflorum TaxID=4521 RepID=A0AAD8VTD3_LOLMU|nr:hypothetical protein QYE76_022623 [Lolium multiflorum]